MTHLYKVITNDTSDPKNSHRSKYVWGDGSVTYSVARPIEECRKYQVSMKSVHSEQITSYELVPANEGTNPQDNRVRWTQIKPQKETR